MRARAARAAGQLLIAACCLVGGLCHAGPAFTSKSVHLRAGPGRVYPAIAILSPGVRVDVIACVHDYSWCDVVAPGVRGWIYAGNLLHPHDGRDVVVIAFGAAIGIGIVEFVFDDYWHEHYRDSPWYHDRQRWEPAHRPVTRPRRPWPPGHPPSPPQPPAPRKPPTPPHSPVMPAPPAGK